MCIKTMIVQNVTKDKIQKKQIYEMILKENLKKHKNTRKKTIVKFPINENLINLKQLDVRNKDKYSKYKN